MLSYLEHPIKSLSSLTSRTKAWHFDLNPWINSRRNRVAAEKYADLVSGLDPHIRYDIGLCDRRPPPAKSDLPAHRQWPI